MKTKQDFPSINERPPEGVRVDGTKIRVLMTTQSSLQNSLDRFLHLKVMKS